jgi:hypothetical protein
MPKLLDAVHTRPGERRYRRRREALLAATDAMAQQNKLVLDQ